MKYKVLDNIQSATMSDDRFSITFLTLVILKQGDNSTHEREKERKEPLRKRFYIFSNLSLLLFILNAQLNLKKER